MIQLICDKLYYLTKDNLKIIIQTYLKIEKTDKDLNKLQKSDLLSIINENITENIAVKLADKGFVGFNLNEAVERLGVDKYIVKKLEKAKVLDVVDYYKVRAYGRYLNCPYYNINQVIELSKLSKEEIESKIRKPTKKQLENIEKAREIYKKKRTCSKCGFVVNTLQDLTDGICKSCKEDEYYSYMIDKIINDRKVWMNNRKDYIILDVETTGLDDDEVIEISIIDLKGTVLFDTLIKPKRLIPIEATYINGISDDMVKDSPTFDLVYNEFKKVIEGKSIIGFNIQFDIRMIYNTMKIYDIKDRLNNITIDLMEQEMTINHTDRYISLVNSVNNYKGEEIHQIHRAVNDCYICLELIKRSIEWESSLK